MGSMLAGRMYGYGKPSEKIKIEQVAKPKAVKGKLLIKIEYSSINPVDYKILSGWYKLVQKVKFPAAIGFDLSGVVVESEDEEFSIGDKVMASLPHSALGAFAEYCLCPTWCCVKLDDGIELKDAAAAAMTGLTVIQSFDKLRVKSGDSILIHAGSGGVGSLAIQYAKHIGAIVYTTTSSRNERWVKDLGADHVICYDKVDFTERCKDLDHVFDTMGKEIGIKSVKVLKEGGHMVSISGGIDENAAKRLGVNWFFRALIRFSSRKLRKSLRPKNIAYNYVLMNPDKDSLRQLNDLLSTNVIKPVIQEEIALKELHTAYEKIMTNRNKGKIVIKP